MADFIYLEDGEIKVSDTAMQIPEFKEFKRYDRSADKKFFNAAMSYIFFVYKVFGDDKDKVSYLHNLSLPQRKTLAVKHHTSTWKSVSDFEDNEYVSKCIEAYLRYDRTPSETLFDALKVDIDMFRTKMSNMPHTLIKKVYVDYTSPDIPDFTQRVPIEVEYDNSKERIDAIKNARDLDDLYKKTLADVKKDAKEKKINQRRFEDPKEVAKISLNENEIPMK